LGLPQLPKWPSEYAHDHFWWGMNRNPVGVRIAQAVGGLDRLMWANDFPHLESDWPNSDKIIEECSVGLSEEQRYMLTVGNAADYFGLNGD
jgi:predicted TIM-barrel fold metal-dependent hydrolase